MTEQQRHETLLSALETALDVIDELRNYAAYIQPDTLSALNEQISLLTEYAAFERSRVDKNVRIIP